MRILITGGAGFVGCAMAHAFRGAQPGNEVVVLDNLRRRGSELNLPGLRRAGIPFVHGDVRVPSDLQGVDGTFDVLLECSAEPSVHAGIGHSPRYLLDSNLAGAVNCLEFAQQRCGAVLFLSTSRAYASSVLRALPLRTHGTRLDWEEGHPPIAGVSHEGVSEACPTEPPGSFYGASKLAAELLCREFDAHGKVPVVISRCGVIAGAGQFGRTDQGVFTLWVARHLLGLPLAYTGYGGHGHQVRDLLHPLDLHEALTRQLERLPAVRGRALNLGGGRPHATSLLEWTATCQAATGRSVPIASDPATVPADIPWFITDHAEASRVLGWAPTRPPLLIAQEAAAWVRAHESSLREVLA